MESRLRTEFQSHLSLLDVASFQRQFEVTTLKLSSLEEPLANVTSSQSLALLSTRLERNEKLLLDLQPQISMTHVWSRRLDTFDSELSEFGRVQASLPTLDVKVHELESQMSGLLVLVLQFEAWNSRLGVVEAESIGFKARLEVIEKTSPPPPLPLTDGATSSAVYSIHSRVSALEARVPPLHNSFLQCSSCLGALQSQRENEKESATRTMDQIREKNTQLETSHRGMRSEFEVVVGQVGDLTARVDEFNGEEFFGRFRINEIARRQLDLIAQTALADVLSCGAKVRTALESFVVSPGAFRSMFEGCFPSLGWSFNDEVSDLTVGRISDSLTTFPPVLTILSRLSKVQEDVSSWSEWKGDDETPHEAVEVSHTSSSSAYHDTLRVDASGKEPVMTGSGDNSPMISVPRVVHNLPPQFSDSQFLRVHPVFGAMASGKSELFRRDPIRDVPVEKIFLDRWCFASFVINTTATSVSELVKRNSGATPLSHEEDLKQSPEPQELL